MPKKKKEGLPSAEGLAMQQTARPSEQTAGPSGVITYESGVGGRGKDDAARREARRIWNARYNEKIKNDPERWAARKMTEARYRAKTKDDPKRKAAAKKSYTKYREKTKNEPGKKAVKKMNNARYWKRTKNIPKKQETRRINSARKWKELKADSERHEEQLKKRKVWDATYREKRKAARNAAAALALSAQQATGMQRTMPPLMLVSALTDAEKEKLEKLGKALSQADPAVQSPPDFDDDPLTNKDPLRKKMNLQKALDLNRLREHSATDTAVAAVGAPMSGIDEGNNYDRFTSPALTRKRPAGQAFRTDDMQPDIEYKKPKRTLQQGK